MQGLPAMLALSSRPWFCYNFMSKYFVAPLSYDAIEQASWFASEQWLEGIVGILGNTLRIFKVDKLGEMFNQIIMPLHYTARSMTYNSDLQRLITVESDHLCYTSKLRSDIKKQIFAATGDEDYNKVSESQVGYPKASEGVWASWIRIIDPSGPSTVDMIELIQNEAAFSLLVTNKLGKGDLTYCIVGTAKDMTLHPRACTVGYIYIYYFDEEGKLKLLHKTPTEDVPLCFDVIGNRLCVGIGCILRIYDLGQK